jgi:uncharacterized membrane protein YbjE (DUF340 family)
MGFRIGRSEDVIHGIATVGLRALTFAAATVGGTIAVLAFLGSLRRRAGRGSAAHARQKAGPVSWVALVREPVILLLVLVAGFLAGLFLPIAPDADGSSLLTWILYLLLLLIGIGLGASGIRLREIVTHPDLVLIPLGTIVGSLAGGLAAGVLVGARPGTGLALAAGFGWYSLSGVILTRLDGPAVGAVAFLSNLLRESMALLLIPVLGRTRFPALAIGVGGATSMDVTLPLIEKSCGPKSVVLAVASGGILSLCVPVLVPILYRIGA